MTEAEILDFLQKIWVEISQNAQKIEIYVQILAVILGYGLARVVQFRIKSALSGLEDKFTYPLIARTVPVLVSVSLPATWLAIQFAVLAIIRGLGHPSYILSITCSLLSAWVIIHIFTRLMQNSAWARLVALCVWSITALNILGLLSPTLAFLDSLAFTFGETEISMLKIAKGIVAAIIVFWITLGLSKFAEGRIQKSKALTPSVQVLLAKLVRVGLIAAAILIVLSNSGINITAFAVFSGALGVGIGFGLQKVVSNLISGVILLLDRSIKPGDVIEVGQTYGRVHSMGARYASVITRDATEYLIPNEDLITQHVVNWSYTSHNIRLKCPIGVSYNSDIPAVIKLTEETAVTIPRVLSNPAPRCLMRGFGDSSIDLELRFWITDPENGCANVTSEVLVAIWKAYKEAGVEIPFPQRDVRVEMISSDQSSTEN
ncbi:mechanosensitive ion channel [Sneathiella sp. P13V-1]|uniref:mechanosensitive ion channel family protein n=1 Tax=Sneathiella sp. P13V-1 TaxID=2697366 RepID=UPI00187B6B08|nr:mechanosensitive ion channel domain-containing protein [Sneathiella sp. P13V-1]MBE7636362.1 mechanosensitive ion channel [Sneathiella sp. P13V-1]